MAKSSLKWYYGYILIKGSGVIKKIIMGSFYYSNIIVREVSG
jgi:hypothetical protein